MKQAQLDTDDNYHLSPKTYALKRKLIVLQKHFIEYADNGIIEVNILTSYLDPWL